MILDQFRYIKIQPKTKDLSTRLWRITTEFVGFILQSLMLSRNWSVRPISSISSQLLCLAERHVSASNSDELEFFQPQPNSPHGFFFTGNPLLNQKESFAGYLGDNRTLLEVRRQVFNNHIRHVLYTNRVPRRGISMVA